MASIKFHLEKPYIPNTDKKLKTSEVSIYVVFTKSRKERFSITVDEKIIPRYWNFADQCVKGTHPRHLEINLYLQKVKYDLQNLYGKHRDLPFEKFKAIATTGKGSEKKTLFVAMDLFLNTYKAEKDEKTFKKYRALSEHLKEFDQKHPVDLPTLDFNFYDRFKDHLYSVPNPNYTGYALLAGASDTNTFDIVPSDDGFPIGLFDDTVYKYIINLKTFCKWAEKRGYQVNQSYKQWEVITRRHDPITLTMEELERLENFQFTEETIKPFVKKHGEVTRIIKALDIARDYLVFECRTGQRISDIKRFDLKDFSNNKWTFTPRKGNRITNKSVTVFFMGYCAQALTVLEKYNWKMPPISEQKINDNIKTACKVVGINSPVETFRWARNRRIRISGPKYEFLSSHTGRRSFITLAIQEKIPVEVVMSLVGIDDYKTIKHYRGKFDEKRVQEYLEGIESKAIMKKVQ